MDQIKVFITDDHYLIREGIKRTLKGLGEIVFAGESSDVDIMLERIAEVKPDILLLEINLCKRPLNELIKVVKAKSNSTRILVLSDCNCEMKVFASVRSGIAGFIGKKVDKEELKKAILDIYSGIDYFTPAVTRILMKGLFSPNSQHFSDRELEILHLICQGMTNDTIAEQLFLSEKTVATHKRNIMKKASVRRTSDLILWALDSKIVSRTSV